MAVRIYVELDEFCTSDLIRELRVRGVITEHEAKTLTDREKAKDAKALTAIAHSMFESDTPLSLAVDCARRGALSESLVYLVRALPDLHPLERLARSA